jgi:hypothetical protein
MKMSKNSRSLSSVSWCFVAFVLGLGLAFFAGCSGEGGGGSLVLTDAGDPGQDDSGGVGRRGQMDGGLPSGTDGGGATGDVRPTANDGPRAEGPRPDAGVNACLVDFYATQQKSTATGKPLCDTSVSNPEGRSCGAIYFDGDCGFYGGTVSGKCLPQQLGLSSCCYGCIDSRGRCQVGNEASLCGHGGDSCDVCAGGKSCKQFPNSKQPVWGCQ